MNDRDRAEQIEREIAETRAEVSATLDAIQSKLTPGQMVDEAIRYVRTSLPADFGRNMAETTRNNPVPIALIGIGIAWLAISGRQGSVTRSQPQYAGIPGEYPDISGEYADEPSVADRARNAVDRARGAAEQARARVGQTVRGAQEKAHELSDRSRRAYYQARSTVSQVVDEQPLVIGALGLAIGAAIGAAMPRTEQENALMGDARDDLIDSASETARNYAERAKESASNAMRSVTERSEEEARTMEATPRSAGSV